MRSSAFVIAVLATLLLAELVFVWWYSRSLGRDIEEAFAPLHASIDRTQDRLSSSLNSLDAALEGAARKLDGGFDRIDASPDRCLEPSQEWLDDQEPERPHLRLIKREDDPGA